MSLFTPLLIVRTASGSGAVIMIFPFFFLSKGKCEGMRVLMKYSSACMCLLMLGIAFGPFRNLGGHKENIIFPSL